MKKTSLQPNRRQRKSTIQVVIVALIILAGVIALDVFDRNPLSGVAVSVTTPILEAKQAVAERIESYVSLVQSKRALVEEVERQQERLNELANIAIAHEALEEEYDELLHLFGRDLVENSIIASVVSHPPSSGYDTLIIDVGTEDGVRAGDRVVAYGDYIIGFVSRVFARSAQVTLYSSPGERVNVFIGADDVAGVAVGRGGGNFEAELPRDALVSEGDIVTLSSLRTQVFTVVEEITRNETDAFQRLLFRAPVNIYTLKRVSVLPSRI